MGRLSSRFLSKTHQTSLDCRVSRNVRDCCTHPKFSGPEFQSMPFALHPLYVLSGFAVGFLVGMTGVGGGALMTPLLILLFHVHPTTAVGTDLLYASITKTGGSLVHGLNRTINWRIVGRLALGSLPASLLTLLVFHFLAIDPAAMNALITRILGVALLATALALVFRKRLLASYSRRVGVLSENQTIGFT